MYDAQSPVDSRPDRAEVPDIELVAQLVAAAAGDEPVDAALRHIVEFLHSSFDAASAGLWLIAASGDVRLAAATGMELPSETPCVPLDHTSCRPVEASIADRPEILADLPLRGPVEIRGWAASHRIVALISVPLLLDRQRLGRLELFFSRPASLAVAERLREWGGRISRLIARRQDREQSVSTTETLAAVLRGTPAAVIGFDRGGNVTSWNPAAEHIFGWRPDEVLGRPARIVPLARRGEFDQQLQQILAGERSAQFETQRQRSDGAAVDVLTTFAACHSARGDVHGAVEVLVDITSRRQAELHRQALLRVQEIADDAHTVEDAGPAILQTLCEMSGWDQSELWLVEPEQRVLRRVSTWGVRRHGDPPGSDSHERTELPPGSGLPGIVWQQRKPVFMPELTDHRAGHGTLPAAMGRSAGFGMPILHRQQVIGVVTLADPAQGDPDAELRQTLASIAHVIGQFLVLQRRETALAEAQAQLRQSQKMDAVGLLTGGIAHDFNNVLTVILSYSELAGEEVEPDHPAHEMLTEIFNAGQRAATMTRRLLTFSRRQDEQPVLINPNELVADIQRMIRRLIGPNIALETSLAESIGPICADAGQLEQVLVNFVVNARDAMPEGGRITISTHALTLRSADVRRHPGARSGEYVGIAVTDTGCGMDAATKRRIFEPFFTTKAPGRGTGMGLATVAAIVRNCGGFIEVDSGPGRGTSMHVFLPRADETLATQIVDAIPADCPTGTETIVVVDEDETIRTLMRRIIQVRGYHVLEAVDGGDCLRIIRESTRPVSLVLTNVVMPGMGGGELAQHLRRISPETHIMFLVDCTEERHAAGVDGAVLQKPFTSDGLARKIRAVLDAHAAP